MFSPHPPKLDREPQGVPVDLEAVGWPIARSEAPAFLRAPHGPDPPLQRQEGVSVPEPALPVLLASLQHAG